MIKNLLTFIAIAILSFPCCAAREYSDLYGRLSKFIDGKDAKIGVAVIIDGVDTVSVNGCDPFPMLSVFKFPIAMAVADYCMKNGTSFSETLRIPAHRFHRDTYSPMIERYGRLDTAVVSIDTLLDYAVKHSDNNASDLLLDYIGGVERLTGYFSSINAGGISVKWNEDDMHKDVSRCYENVSTPVAMTRLLEYFDLRCNDTLSSRIKQMMEGCETGLGRLPAALRDGEGVIGHKTGTGDMLPSGRVMAVNDVGYIHLRNGRRCSIAVFVADSAYSFPEAEGIIAEISAMILSVLR